MKHPYYEIIISTYFLLSPPAVHFSVEGAAFSDKEAACSSGDDDSKLEKNIQILSDTFNLTSNYFKKINNKINSFI